MLWNLACPVGLSQKRNMHVRISMNKVWRILDGPSKNLEFVELRSDFELSRSKVAQIGPSRC